jgi:hypothetical protein
MECIWNPSKGVFGIRAKGVGQRGWVDAVRKRSYPGLDYLGTTGGRKTRISPRSHSNAVLQPQPPPRCPRLDPRIDSGMERLE